MRCAWLACWLLVVGLGRPLLAQAEAPADLLELSASQALTWEDEPFTVIQLQGPVSIQFDRTTITAGNAVAWVSPIRNSVSGARLVELSLLGDVRIVQPNGIERTARAMFVDAPVRGPIRISAPQRMARNASASPLYAQAAQLRPVLLKGGEPSGQWIESQPAPTTQPAATQPAQRVLRPVSLAADRFQTEKTPDGKIVAILTGNVTLTQRGDQGDLIELLADRAVAFTPYTDLREITPAQQIQKIEQAVTGVYLEGDVRILRTPANQALPDQRLSANRAFYDFTTDRAVLTDAVIQTTDLKTSLPIVVRARTIRQLSAREYSAEKVRLSTSTFATPSYSLGASSIYIRQTDVGDEVTGTRTHFRAEDATLRLGETPIFYLPVVAGSVTERMAIRNIAISSSNGFGFGVSTTWGLFETLGRLPPRGMDVTYSLDYFSERGPAVGLDGTYSGGFIDQATLDPWTYAGSFTAYTVWDQGEDDLGRKRRDVEPDDEFRGRLWWQHQHFLPDDWQVQVTGGYISDETFMEEWFNRTFRTSDPLQTSLYLKRQRDSEAITFLTAFQPNDFVTTAEFYQEQFEIERLPEIGYYRVGDSLWDDTLTFYSANTLSAMKFQNSEADLEDLGFREMAVGRQSPGIPSVGQTGTPEDTTIRGDFRQEIAWPFSMSQFRAMPYVVGRYTQYTESVDGTGAERLYSAAGVRVTTAFWKVDDTVQSRFFDLHRLRHVVEPSIHAYVSAQNTDRNELLLYDEEVDAITDITALQVALNQRWQTKRGGPGQWRSVDFFTLNVALNYFSNEPPEEEMYPNDFRGLFYVSRPEASIARNSVNTEAAWRISDAYQVVSDIYYNTDENELSAASIGLNVRHDPRIAYHIGLRHVGVDFTRVVDGNTFVFESQDLLIFALDYQLTAKYRLNLANSYDFAQNRQHRSAITLIRRFDRLFAALSLRVDRLDNDTGVMFNLWPEGIAGGGGSGSAQNLRNFLAD